MIVVRGSDNHSVSGGSAAGNAGGGVPFSPSPVPFSFVVALKPASGQVLISGGPIGTHEIPIDQARVLYDGLHEALVTIPAIAKVMAG